jgi:hypothetical protein
MQDRNTIKHVILTRTKDSNAFQETLVDLITKKGDVKININKLHDLVLNHITNEVKLRGLLC